MRRGHEQVTWRRAPSDKRQSSIWAPDTQTNAASSFRTQQLCSQDYAYPLYTGRRWRHDASTLRNMFCTHPLVTPVNPLEFLRTSLWLEGRALGVVNLQVGETFRDRSVVLYPHSQPPIHKSKHRGHFCWWRLRSRFWNGDYKCLLIFFF
jgi:hypothetical protein